MKIGKWKLETGKRNPENRIRKAETEIWKTGNGMETEIGTETEMGTETENGLLKVEIGKWKRKIKIAIG